MAAFFLSPNGAVACSFIFNADPEIGRSVEIAKRFASNDPLPRECAASADAACLLAVSEPRLISKERPAFSVPTSSCSDPRVPPFRLRAALLFAADRGDDARRWLEQVPSDQRRYALDLSGPLIATLVALGRDRDAEWVAETFSNPSGLAWARARPKETGSPAELATSLISRDEPSSAIYRLGLMAQAGEMDRVLALLTTAAASGAQLSSYGLVPLLDPPWRVRLTLAQAKALLKTAEAMRPPTSGDEMGGLYRAIYKVAVYSGDTELGDWAMGHLPLKDRTIEEHTGPLPRWSDVDILRLLQRRAAILESGQAGQEEIEGLVSSLMLESAPFIWKHRWLEDLAISLIQKGNHAQGLRLLRALPVPEAPLAKLIGNLRPARQ